MVDVYVHEEHLERVEDVRMEGLVVGAAMPIEYVRGDA